MWWRRRFEDWYVVDTSGLARHEEVAACRAVLELVASEISQFQYDVPWACRDSWSPEIVEAARTLAPDARSDEYVSQGWITDFDEAAWRAFVMFAAYAYSADAWSADAQCRIELADEGTSVAVRLPQDQIARLRALIPAADVVPLAGWRQRPRAFD